MTPAPTPAHGSDHAHGHGHLHAHEHAHGPAHDVQPSELTEWAPALRARGLRVTPARVAVLDALRSAGHSSPEDVHEVVNASAVNLSTVYRTLELLAEAVGLCGRFKAERDDLDGELEALKGKLGRGGRKRFGSKPEEREVVEEILRLVGGGLSYGATAERLNEAGRRTQAGKAWRAQQVKNVVAHERSAGSGG